MKITINRAYWTLGELAEKWKLSAADLHRLVMSDVLKPCVMLDQDLLPVSMVEGQPVPIGDPARVRSWLYPVFPRQTLPFDCEFEVLCDMVEPVEGALLWGLPQPMRLSQVMAVAVVMDEDVKAAEAALRDADDALTTKQENTRDKLLVAMATELCGWDPAGERSVGVTKLVGITQAWGLPVCYNSIKEHLRIAWDRAQPSV